MKRSWIKRKPKKDRVFKDGRTRLANKSELRVKVFTAAGFRCERIIDGKRCNKPAPLDGPEWKQGHLAHRKHGAGKRDDTPAGTWCFCGDCHRETHNPKPCPDKSALERMTAEALDPTTPVPGHADGCPCHRCRLARGKKFLGEIPNVEN